MTTPVDSLQKQVERTPDGRFEKGQSGNPAGRAAGSRNRATLAAEALLDGEAAALTRKALEMALDGNTTALRLCFDRIIAPRRHRPVELPLPAIEGIADLAPVMTAVTEAAARGAITPGEALELARVVETVVQAIETTDFARRLEMLEEIAAR